MSVLVFTGASQFAVVSILGAGGNAAARPSVRRRSSRPGTPCTDRWSAGGSRDRPPARSIAQLVIDESTGVGAAQPDAARARRGFLVTGIGTCIAWNLGTFVGLVAR